LVNDSEAGSSSRASNLAMRIGRGDRDAEEELIRHYGPRLEFILGRHVREPSLAADLRQESLIIVLQKLREGSLNEPDKLAAFLYQTAINLARGEARTYHRRNTWPDSEQVDLAIGSEPLLADRIEKEQLAQIIRELLGELAQERDQQILRRFYLSEESKPDICRSLSVTSAHFDRVLHRARQRFRKILQHHFGKRSGPHLDDETHEFAKRVRGSTR
jgi:RNA polymerase sigma factor (sigma-70 family)